MAKSKYGAAHRKARTAWERTLNAQGSLSCALCPNPVRPWQEWDLDHVPGTSDQYRGVTHASCNRSEGARRGNRARSTPKPRPLVL